MAYNSSNGVCFEAIKDIKAGEELMALFDSLKGTVIVESYLGKSGGEGDQKNERRWSRKFLFPPPPPSTSPFISFFFFFFNFVFALVMALLMNGCTQKRLLRRLQ